MAGHQTDGASRGCRAAKSAVNAPAASSRAKLAALENQAESEHKWHSKASAKRLKRARAVTVACRPPWWLVDAAVPGTIFTWPRSMASSMSRTASMAEIAAGMQAAIRRRACRV